MSHVNKSRNGKFLLEIKAFNALLVTKAVLFGKIFYFRVLNHSCQDRDLNPKIVRSYYP